MLAEVLTSQQTEGQRRELLLECTRGSFASNITTCKSAKSVLMALKGSTNKQQVCLLSSKMHMNPL